jgi:hypothetical protein
LACIAGLLLLAALARPAAGQADDERQRAVAALEAGRLEAALYAIRRLNDDRVPIELHEESLLQWNNSVNQSVHGNIFVWTKNGRPEVVASIYRFYSPKVEFAAEFQSLSLDPLVVEKHGTQVWAPQQPGIVLQAFDDDGAPPSSRPQRLAKMKQLAGQFDVELTDWSGETYQLRLLPKPLFRYEPADSAVLDGALFAFTYTTDPELLVAVEARDTAAGPRWMYGLARMNVGDLKVSYREREVWQAERLEHPYLDEDGVYTLFKDLPLPAPQSSGR